MNAPAIPQLRADVQRIRNKTVMLATKCRKTQFVYLISCNGTPYTKIGRTTKTVNARLNDLQTSNPHLLQIVYVIECYDSAAIEEYLHTRFRSRNVRNEWFQLTAQDIETIKTYYPQGIIHE